jgi:hypothetical protein
MALMPDRAYYWRFKGEKEFRYAFVVYVGRGLYRMSPQYGDGDRDRDKGPIVDPEDIEVR